MSVQATHPYADLGLAMQSAPVQRQQLGQAEFLKLMTTQLQNQDPFKPMESGEFLGQIAQFSTVSGIQQLNEAFTGLSGSLTANQALQAGQLVGRSVLVPSETATLAEDGALRAAVDVPASGQVVVDVLDAGGQVVRRLDLGTQPAGRQSFAWDGLDAGGERLPAGGYALRATLVQGATQTGLDTSAIATVRSVAMDGGSLMLELDGLAPVSLADIQQIL